MGASERPSADTMPCAPPILRRRNSDTARMRSLRAAIANVCPGGTISFDPALNGQTIVLTNGELVLNKHLTILGPGATNLAISGNASSRAFSRAAVACRANSSRKRSRSAVDARSVPSSSTTRTPNGSSRSSLGALFAGR